MEVEGNKSFVEIARGNENIYPGPILSYGGKLSFIFQRRGANSGLGKMGDLVPIQYGLSGRGGVFYVGMVPQRRHGPGGLGIALKNSWVLL